MEEPPGAHSDGVGVPGARGLGCFEFVFHGYLVQTRRGGKKAFDFHVIGFLARLIRTYKR